MTADWNVLCFVMADDAPPGHPGQDAARLDDHNRAFWTGGADGRLRSPGARGCELWVQPTGRRLPSLRRCAATPAGLRSRDRVHLHRQSPAVQPAVPVPYVIAIVELEEQADLRIATNIVDCEPDSVYIGLPVEVRFERQDADGASVFVPVFAPRR